MIRRFSKLQSPSKGGYTKKKTSKPIKAAGGMPAQARIMLVDDSPDNVGQIKNSLQRLAIKYFLHTCLSASEALEMIKDEKNPVLPQAVIVSIDSEARQGIRFLEHIRADKTLEDLDVFILSESASEVSSLMERKIRISGYVVNPLQLQPGKNTTRMDSFVVGHLRKFLLNKSY